MLPSASCVDHFSRPLTDKKVYFSEIWVMPLKLQIAVLFHRYQSYFRKGFSMLFVHVLLISHV